MSNVPLRADLSDPLWVPVLTHYHSDGSIDIDRMKANLANLRPDVRQIMLGGSTGDGWELDDARFAQLLDLALNGLRPDHTVIFGALQPTTETVIERIRIIEEALAVDPILSKRCHGAVVCPPVGKDVSQPEILAHFHRVLETSTVDLAAYQLPQITGCRIEPETMRQLAGSPRITMFKDSSGEDTVAMAGLDYGGVALVRGAEGGYLEALRPAGPYDGWLLSTGNALAGHLHDILDAMAHGDRSKAAAISSALSSVVAEVFAAAADEGGANTFSNANRAMDHLRAYGRKWRDAPLPLKVDGNAVSTALIARVEQIAAVTLGIDDRGYLG